ncbi:MAG: hypothetical protein WBM86_07140 [Waterburya sp.]
MSYSIKQLPNRRWGIYAQNKLLATFGCHDQCLKVLELLKKRMMLIAKTNKVPALSDNQAA